MKIRGKDRKIDIDTILIQKDSSGGTNISIIVNNQLLRIWDKGVYTDTILEKINDFIKIIGV